MTNDDEARGDLFEFEFAIGTIDGTGRKMLYYKKSIVTDGKRALNRELLTWLAPEK